MGMTRRLLVLVLVLTAAVVVGPAPAGAQGDGCVVDPYSGGQACPPPECSLEQKAVEGGRQVRVTGRGFVPDTDITGTFDGEVVFTLRTTDGTFDVTFVTPQRPPGTYNVVVRDSTGQECDPPIVIPGPDTAVLGTSVTRGGADVAGTNVSRPAGNRGSGGGSGPAGLSGLARTGIAVAVLVAVAVVLLVAGGVARAAARRR